MTASQAARLANVGKRTMDDAKIVRANGAASIPFIFVFKRLRV
jgi:hypothetical protein